MFEIAVDASLVVLRTNILIECCCAKVGRMLGERFAVSWRNHWTDEFEKAAFCGGKAFKVLRLHDSAESGVYARQFFQFFPELLELGARHVHTGVERRIVGVKLKQIKSNQINGRHRFIKRLRR